MKFLADAHISVAMVDFIRSQGCDCTYARDLPDSLPDDEVLALAVDEKRVVLTTDTDFGQLVFRDSLPVVGVLLMRVRRLETETERIDRLRSNWSELIERLAGHVVTLTRDGTRSRPLE